ncbi:MAG: L,D-transpeptidase family protein [Deltaproteobacteria bacterium]|nr:L,D-transpeptidase family protein [Deltaproteobacteria bacterium]
MIRFIFVLMALLWPTELFAVDTEEMQEAFLETLQIQPARFLGVEGNGMDSESIDLKLWELYHDNNLQGFWVSTNGPGKRAKAILDALQATGSHGLDPQRYFADRIEKYWNSTDALNLARLDILLTLGLRNYVWDLRFGRSEPRKLDPELFASARNVDVDWDQITEQALSTPNIEAFLDEQMPPYSQYKKLMKVLAEYRAIENKGGWDMVPEGKVLKPDMQNERVGLIRKRLAVTGDLASDHLDGMIYDNEVVEAVKAFQSRHGLTADGVVGAKTLSAMNVPVDSRIRQILVNMERYRWLSHHMEEPFIAVNIAGFRAGGVNKGVFEIEMPVIVGREYHETPVFSDAIKYIEFNPYWNVPTSIAMDEMLPKLKKNPNYLKERNFRVFSSWEPDAKELDSTALDWQGMGRKDIARLHIRQEPGPRNALGTVKFMFPNKYSVYLHDTPSHSLFKMEKRAFSHGCIRVSKPAELAAYILGGEAEGFGIEHINEIIASGKRKVVVLKKPFPVLILYRTLVVDPESGKINFREDVYGRDALLEKALFCANP